MVDQVAVVREIARVLSDVNVAGPQAKPKKLRVYSIASEHKDAGFPEAMNDYPAAVVYLGAQLGWELEGGNHVTSTYLVNVEVMTDGPTLDVRMARAAPLQMKVAQALTAAYGGLMGNREGSRLVTYCTFRSSDGIKEMQWGDAEALLSGYRMQFEVVESGSITIGTGA